MTSLDILLVEDSPLQLDAIALAIEGLTFEQRSAAGIASMCITKANCGATARHYLAEAVTQERPYDLLILDLSLPEQPGGIDIQDLGFELLEIALKQKAVKGVVIISVFDELARFVAPAFQRGAAEFITKPYNRDELQQRVLRALGLIRERYRQQLEEQRTKEGAAILDGLTNELTYHFGACFSQFVQAVSYETDELRAALQKELSVDFSAQPEHPLALRLQKFSEAANEAQQKWNALQTAFKYDQQGSEEVDISVEIRQLERNLRPCVVLDLTAGFDVALPVLSFQKNVRIVLKELLIGGLSATNTQRVWHVKAQLRQDDGFAIIEFEDDFPTLNPATMDLINRGEAIAPKREDWRAWGLSVAQHLALRGGGRLEIKSRSNAEGNLITYLIPLA